MSVLQAIVLGIVQGLAEFLHISSSAHLILVPWLFGWQDPGLAFDVALHWGTLVAVLAVFWRDWIRLIRAGAASLLDRRIGDDPDRRLFWALVVSSIPAAVVGKLFHETVEETVRSPLIIAGTMSVMGIVLWLADRRGAKNRPEGDMRIPEALGIGVAQAFALVPGVSRSGSTISVGLFLGFTREEIARFSFLMSTPIIFGAGALKLPQMLREAREEVGLDPRHVEILGQLDDCPTFVTGYVILPVVGVVDPLAFTAAGQYPWTPSAAEIAELHELPLDAFMDPGIRRVEQRLRDGQPYELTWYTVGGAIVWGATARILRQLIEIANAPVEAS